MALNFFIVTRVRLAELPYGTTFERSIIIKEAEMLEKKKRNDYISTLDATASRYQWLFNLCTFYCVNGVKRSP